jgi:histidyl-tRNA synthetase
MSGKDEEQIAAIRAGGTAPYALRPEFTPTLARMVAAKAAELPRPIKWFAIPNHFRAERPQRGRLREFMQWNVDFIGDDSPRADAEVIATAVSSLAALGLSPLDVRVRYGNRKGIEEILLALNVRPEQFVDAISLFDQLGKVTTPEIERTALEGALPREFVEFLQSLAKDPNFLEFVAGTTGLKISAKWQLRPEIANLEIALATANIAEWCTLDMSIVRGLAYYTGTVFEIHEATGAERAIAGGGRYDNLIESFGGPKLPACGFGMGDVVLANILRDKGLLNPSEEYLPRPDAFVIAADDDAAARVSKVVASLRTYGLHVRQSYKTTRNVGKMLGEASKCRSRLAVILGKELAENRVVVKDMESGEQREVTLDELATTLRHQP